MYLIQEILYKYILGVVYHFNTDTTSDTTGKDNHIKLYITGYYGYINKCNKNELFNMHPVLMGLNPRIKFNFSMVSSFAVVGRCLDPRGAAEAGRRAAGPRRLRRSAHGQSLRGRGTSAPRCHQATPLERHRRGMGERAAGRGGHHDVAGPLLRAALLRRGA